MKGLEQQWINYIVDQHVRHSAGEKVRASGYVDVVYLGLEITRAEDIRMLLRDAIKEERGEWLDSND